MQTPCKNKKIYKLATVGSFIIFQVDYKFVFNKKHRLIFYCFYSLLSSDYSPLPNILKILVKNGIIAPTVKQKSGSSCSVAIAAISDPVAAPIPKNITWNNCKSA